MSAYLKRYSLFRSQPRHSESFVAAGPAVAEDLAASQRVIEISDAADDGFTDITVRPMTYAEVARGNAPVKPAVLETAPFSAVDEAQWAVNEVQRYIRECETRPAPPSAATIVISAPEYMDQAESADRRFQHSKRGRRASRRRTRH